MVLLAYIDQTGDRRLVKHGYDRGALKRVLRERNLATSTRMRSRAACLYRRTAEEVVRGVRSSRADERQRTWGRRVRSWIELLTRS